MNLKGILSISGQGGLYKLLSQARNGIIVESLETKKRMPAYASSKISALEDISMFTNEGDVHLSEVFTKIFEMEDGGQAINHKSSANELKSYFKGILPNYDEDRVYVSDIKRVINWYNILQRLELLNVEEEEEETTTETEEVKEETTEEVSEKE